MFYFIVALIAANFGLYAIYDLATAMHSGAGITPGFVVKAAGFMFIAGLVAGSLPMRLGRPRDDEDDNPYR